MKRHHRIYIALGLLTSLGLACSSGDQAQPEDEKPDAASEELTIGVMPKLVGIDYFNATKQGAREAARELGIQLDYDGPATNDVTLQSRMVETWITKGYNAIAVAPNDPDAIAVVLKKAMKRGIDVLTWDADAEPSSRDFFVNQSTSEAIAKTLVDLMAKHAGEDANFIYLTGSLTAANQNMWMADMDEYMAENYPDMTNLSETPKASEEDQALATRVTTDSLKVYSELDGIFALTSVALPGAAEALRKAGKADEVFLTGLATPNAMRDYVNDGTVKKFVMWDVPALGYLTVQAAVASVKGSLQPGDESFEAGSLGEVGVQDDQVLLGNPVVFDAGNIDNYDF